MPTSEKKLFYCFLALLLWLPLPMGSNRAWAWSLMDFWIFSLGLWACLLYLNKHLVISHSFKKAKVLLPFFTVWLFVLLLQVSSLPNEILDLLSQQSRITHAETERVISADIISTISMDRFASIGFVLKTICYGIVFSLTLILLNTRKRIRLLMMLLVISGVFQAVYGGLMVLSGLEYGFFFEKTDYRGYATGTFINRNHLAGYLEMCLAMGIGLMLSNTEGGNPHSARQRIRNVLRWLLSHKMQLRLMLAIMVIGLVLTRSRMGNTAFFTSLLVCGGYWIAMSSSSRSKKTALLLLTSLLLIDVYIVGNWFGVDKVVQRLQATSKDSESRDEVVHYGLNYLADYNLFGSGGGSFYSVFPSYRGADVQIYYNHAHNDYLQIAAETGWFGLTASALLVLISLIAGYVAMKSRKKPECRALAFAGTMGIVSILIHSTVDFNLQIPANSIMFVVLLSFCWIGMGYSSNSGKRLS